MMKIENRYFLLAVLLACLMLPIAYILFTQSSTDIPQQKYALNKDLSVKLEYLTPIIFFKNSVYFTTECRYHDIGKTGYYITSSGTSLYDKKAKWTCATNMSFFKCPDLKIEYDNGKAVVEILKGYKADYPPNTVKSCVIEAIKNAPVDFSYRDTELAQTEQNLEAWKKN